MPIFIFKIFVGHSRPAVKPYKRGCAGSGTHSRNLLYTSPLGAPPRRQSSRRQTRALEHNESRRARRPSARVRECRPFTLYSFTDHVYYPVWIGGESPTARRARPAMDLCFLPRTAVNDGSRCLSPPGQGCSSNAIRGERLNQLSHRSGLYAYLVRN